LLKLARDGKGVEAGRAERFARGVVEATELGRMAMAVLAGGLFAGATLVQLAERVLASAGEPRKALVREP
jgi:hypothetical protein